MERENKIKCNQCRFYYITWDKSFPYGCKKMGFKSPIEPAQMVYRSSGTKCQAFEQKA